ncbi:MAG TPA: hypothetical protein ENN45_02415 [Bacteroidetes bacterium]|nr:hypothetical protein [Bacteroidota bacterium]
MRLISQDSELLVILQVLLDKITDSLKNKKCLVITPNNLKLPEENEIKKEKDFSFKAELRDVPANECFRLLGVLLYHLATGQSEYNRESYTFDGYRRPLNSSLWPVIAFMLSGEVKKPEQIEGLLTSDIKKQAKANERDLGKKKDNNFQTANLDEMIREVMGNNCFLTEDWQRVYNVPFSTQPQLPMPFDQFKAILDSPCPFESGKRVKVKDTHFFFWMPEPKTLLEWQEMHPESEQPKFFDYDESWYNDENFAKNTKTRFNCYLIYKCVVPGSINKSYQDQQAMLPSEYEPCLACEFAPVHLLYCQKTNEYLNDDIGGRCQDTDSDGARVYLGYFDSCGLHVFRSSDGRCASHLGVSAFRKLFS